MKKKLKIPLLVLLISVSSINAKNIFVSNDGNNTGDGSVKNPYKTIQFAVDQLNEGDTCFVRGGTYREQVNLKKSHTSLQAYRDEYVLISGADIVSGWEKYKGEIYRAKFTDIEPQFTQLFYKGNRENMARYPDQTTDDMFSLEDNAGYKFLEVKANGKVSFEESLPGPENYWKGGYFRAISAKAGGSNPNGIITSSNGKDIVCKVVSSCWDEEHSAISWKLEGRGKGYIFHLNALDRPGEWYYQNDSIYFWKPGGGKPMNDEVGLERREYTLSAKGKNFITLKNINIKGSNLQLLDCDDCKVENCSFRWLKGWFSRKSYGTSFTQLGGVHIRGSRNIVSSCYFNGSWGSLIGFEGGEDNVLKNSILENTGWMAMFTSSCLSSSKNLKVLWNTFGSSGRFHIRTTEKTIIMHNDFYDCMKMCQDAGCIEVTKGGREVVDINGTVIAYNKLHDMNTQEGWNGKGNQFVAAFYLESAENYVVHHNLVYNITNHNGDGTFSYLGPVSTTINNFAYYNNTMWNVDRGIRVWNKNNEGSVIDGVYNNNLFYKGMNQYFGEPSLQDGFNLKNNQECNDASMFNDVDNNDFTLTSSSVAIDKGLVIEGITDEVKSTKQDDVLEKVTGAAPDCGCFEYGVTPWECGSSLKVREFMEQENTSINDIKKSFDCDFLYNRISDFISFKYKTPFVCNAYSFNGSKVVSKKFKKNRNTYYLNTSKLRKGVYIVNLVNDNGYNSFSFLKK